MSATAAAGRYLGLDGLRGVASFAVVVHHSLILGTDIGGLAVFLFFILSGFLITGILHPLAGEDRGGARERRDRTRRLPGSGARCGSSAYYLWLGIFVVFDVVFRSGAIVPELGWYLTYLQNFYIGFVSFRWDDFTHVWSLAVEQQYYVFFAPLVVLLPLVAHTRLMIVTMIVCLAAIAGLQAIGYEMITLYTSPANGFVFMAAGARFERARTPAWMGGRPALLVARRS